MLEEVQGLGYGIESIFLFSCLQREESQDGIMRKRRLGGVDLQLF